MPIYEFYSPDNNRLYQFLARSLAYRDKTPRCPRRSQLSHGAPGLAFRRDRESKGGNG
jgi:hypothetical protein